MSLGAPDVNYRESVKKEVELSGLSWSQWQMVDDIECFARYIKKGDCEVMLNKSKEEVIALIKVFCDWVIDEGKE